MTNGEPKPCPFNEECNLEVHVYDLEGNDHGPLGCDYESNPWSGLRYGIRHDGPCGLGSVVFGLYSTMNALILDWNARTERTCCDFGGKEGTNGEGYDFACDACGFCCDLPEPSYCPNCGAKVVGHERG